MFPRQVEVTKLWEGNVFRHVCLSAILSTGEGSYVTIIHDALNLTMQGPPV